MSYEDLPLFSQTALPEPSQAQIVCDDVLAWAEKTPPIGAHAMLCDPPYEMYFMSRTWDSTGIAFKADTWKALAQHLLPGAFIMAFAGARTYHRLACAMEDAGLILHSAIGFLQGQGFPKATQVNEAAMDAWAVETYGGWCECDECKE